MATVYLSPVGNGFQWLTTNALAVLAGGKINTYAAGTATPTPTFTDATGTIPNANPIILDASGRSPNEIWFTAGQAYKFVITDSLGVVQFTLDNLPGINDVNLSKLIYTGPSGATESVASAIAALPGQNYILNGNFDAAFNIGPVALPITGDASSVDLWAVFQNNVSAGTSGQVASDVVGNRYYLRMGRNAGSASTDPIVAQSAVRTNDSIALQNQTFSFSFYAKAGANFSGANLSVSVFSGTGIDQPVGAMSSWTGVTLPVSTTQGITTTAALYTFTGTFPTNCTQIGVRVFYVPSGTAGADDNVYLTRIRLERGTIPTNQDMIPYRERVRYYRPDGYCGGCITNFGASDPFSQCQFVSRNGNTVLINGTLEEIPQGAFLVSGGVIATYNNCTLDGTPGSTLVANTDYYIYVMMVAGVMTLNFSINFPPALDKNYGIWVKGNDAASTLVGFLHTDASIHTLGNAQAQTIVSYFNRLRFRLSSTVAGSTASAAFVELNSTNRLQWVQWDDDLVVGPSITCRVGTSVANRTIDMGIGVNSSTVTLGPTWHGVSPDNTTPSMTAQTRTLNPGNSAKGNYFFATSLAQVSGGATLTVSDGALCADNIAV